MEEKRITEKKLRIAKNFNTQLVQKGKVAIKLSKKNIFQMTKLGNSLNKS